MLDARSDLFSLGVVMYEMATRRVPFRDDERAVFVQLFSHTPEPVRDWNESIPKELEKVILKLLAKERKARFQSAKELQDALVKVGGKLGRGGWLGKGSPGVVPLVRAKDPVARHKGSKRKPDWLPNESGAQMLSRIEGSQGDSDSLAIRPLRVPDGDRGGLELRKRYSARGSALAVESGERSVELRSIHGEVAESGSVAAAAVQKIEENFRIARQAWRGEPVLTHMRPGVARVESGVGGLAGVGESPEEASVAEELIAASLEIGARTRGRMVTAAVMIVVGVAVMAMLHSGLFRPLVLGANDHLLLTVIQNKTADKALDGTVMQGIEIALRQSRSLNVLGGEAYRAGLRQIETEGGVSTKTVPEQRVAQKVGARAYLYGEITRSNTSYTVSVDVLKTDSNDKVATLEETAASREEIPAAIGKMAQDIRAEVSEDSKAEMRSSVPLEVEATSSVNALHAYALGEAAMWNGHTGDALAAYQQATTFDPKFVEAQMRLAWLYSAEKAEVASASAAGIARNAAMNASEKVKLLAQFCYEMNASGDYDGAARTMREYAVRYPRDVEGMKGLARLLRMQGNLQGALSVAQKGYSRNPFDAEMYAEAQLAMIRMDDYDDALQLEAQAERAGVVSTGNSLIAGYLAGNEDVIAKQASAKQVAFAGMTTAHGVPVTYAELYHYGLYLDNVGKTGAGSEVWRVAAAIAGSVPELVSTEASMLAQGALDRALMENCTVALEMVDEVTSLPKGPDAAFHAGMAAALCGDQPYAEKTIAALKQKYPQNTAVAQYYVPELQAAAEIGVNEPEKALDSLIALEPYDAISLTPYLRGMAHAALGQASPAVVDFQTVQDHRGSALLLSGNAYPMAQVGVARAYAAHRDRANSAEAYRRFLTLWKDADQGQPLMVETLAKSK